MIKRTKEQRQNEIRTIIKKLNELHLNTSYDGIKIFFRNMKEYVENSNVENSNVENSNVENGNVENCNKNDNDKPIIINIPCPELNVLIKGVLEIDIKKKVWVKLECLEKPEE
jgi:hypothetical protein